MSTKLIDNGVRKKYVIVDIDGTIAFNAARQLRVLKLLESMHAGDLPWTELFESCLRDKPIRPVIDLLVNLANHYHIVFCTSRNVTFREKTREWIDTYTGFYMAPILMRRDNDNHRSDSIVKPELLDRAGINTENTAFILEDKISMVATWRELGFTVLQPANNTF